MTRVLISPSRAENYRYHEDYQLLVEELRNADFEAEILDPPEQRGGVEHRAAEVTFVLEGLATRAAVEAAKALTKAIIRRLRKPPRGPGRRVAVIYGPDGEIISEVELDEE
jgi:hypothetical protein